MANYFTGRGNLGADPELKLVSVDGTERPRVNLRVYMERPVPNGTNGFDDKGGFWLTVILWGNKAESANEHLRKGVGVRVEGTLVLESWKDPNKEEEQRRFVLQATQCDLELRWIDTVTFKPKKAVGGDQPPDEPTTERPDTSPGKPRNRKQPAHDEA